jgi:hypothetical protein
MTQKFGFYPALALDYYISLAEEAGDEKVQFNKISFEYDYFLQFKNDLNI